MLNKIINIFLSVLVFTYIIFEELVWEKTAKPIINLILKYELLKNLEQRLLEINSYVLLGIFLSFFIVVELIGIYAAVLFAMGKVFTAVIIYSSKIPVAIFTFWFFKVTKDKLFTFRWFKYLYEHLMILIDKFKHSRIYLSILEKIEDLKENLKINFFNTKSNISQRLYNLYTEIRKKF